MFCHPATQTSSQIDQIHFIYIAQNQNHISSVGFTVDLMTFKSLQLSFHQVIRTQQNIKLELNSVWSIYILPSANQLFFICTCGLVGSHVMLLLPLTQFGDVFNSGFVFLAKPKWHAEWHAKWHAFVWSWGGDGWEERRDGKMEEEGEKGGEACGICVVNAGDLSRATVCL